MTSPETVLRDNDTTSGTGLYLSFELGDKRWTLTLSDGRRQDGEYLSCGYASPDLASWRPNDTSNPRQQQYIAADMRLVLTTFGGPARVERLNVAS